MALATIASSAFNTSNIFVWIIIGLIAGFLATRVIRGPHFGFIGDIVIGLVGEIVASFIGAVVLLAILRFVAKQTGR